MKNTLKLFSIIFLTGCQTLGLINEDPRAPTALNGDYDEFASQAWSREVVTPIITYQFFGDNIQPSKFFDISGSGVTVHSFFLSSGPRHVPPSPRPRSDDAYAICGLS